MSATITDPRSTLTANLGKLAAGDQRFAASLLGARNPSSKQLHWIGVLAERATKAAQEPESATHVENVAGIVSLFANRNPKLKFPKIAFRAGDRDFRLSIAGERASYPGSINVCSSHGSEWFGRIHRDGRYEPSRRCAEGDTAAVIAALQAFAADPACIAAEYGRITGCCCFCSKDLTDPVSIEVGYGPICAKNYSLPHRATGLRAEAA